MPVEVDAVGFGAGVSMCLLVRLSVRPGVRSHRSSGTGDGIAVFFPRLLAAWSLVYFTGSGLEDGVGYLLDAWNGYIARYKVNYVREGGRIRWFTWGGGRGG